MTDLHRKAHALYAYKATLFWLVQNKAWHCLAEIIYLFNASSLEKSSSWWQHMSLQNYNISFCINRTFTYCLYVITNAVGTNAPPYHHRGWFLQFSVDDLWHVESNVTFLDAVADCVEWQWFSKVLPKPSGYVYHKSMTVSQTIPPQGSMVTHIQQWFPHLAFMYRDLPESFHNIMNCGWRKTYIICSIVLRNTDFVSNFMRELSVSLNLVTHKPSLLAMDPWMLLL